MRCSRQVICLGSRLFGSAPNAQVWRLTHNSLLPGNLSYFPAAPGLSCWRMCSSSSWTGSVLGMLRQCVRPVELGAARPPGCCRQTHKHCQAPLLDHCHGQVERYHVLEKCWSRVPSHVQQLHHSSTCWPLWKLTAIPVQGPSILLLCPRQGCFSTGGHSTDAGHTVAPQP